MSSSLSLSEVVWSVDWIGSNFWIEGAIGEKKAGASNLGKLGSLLHYLLTYAQSVCSPFLTLPSRALSNKVLSYLLYLTQPLSRLTWRLLRA